MPETPQGTSLERAFADSHQRQEDEYEVAMKRYLARKPRKINWPDGRKPTREELYGRPGLR